MNLITFAIFTLFLIGVFCQNEDVFIPTSEWQEIKEGQKIPRGLHVRINLETGKKEAKLPDNSNKQALVATVEHNDDLSISELKQTLKRIKNDANQDSSEQLQRKFKSYEEIKKELSSLNLTPKLDSELIKELVNDYKIEITEAKNNTKIKSILEDLEYLTHQIDNAIEFVNQNGFKDIVYHSLNETNSGIKLMSLRLMSSLMQNNPRVQIHGLETGCITELLKILTLEKDAGVKYQAVGALSSVLRRFPLAQKRFVENGGMSVITKVFEEGNTKMNVKLVTLLIDLVSEHQLSQLNDDTDVLKQYNLINLEEKLAGHQWCENLSTLLHTLVTTDEDNHDYLEKCLRSMNVLAKSCAKNYDVKILNYLLQKYNELGLNDIDKDEESSLSSYFSELKDLCDNLIKFNKVKQKTEL